MTLQRLLQAALMSVLIVCLLLLGAFWWLSLSGRPRRSGDTSIRGLTSPVTVRFDSWRVPHVTGGDGYDLAGALGYLHANDRLLQMELARRSAAGRLAEVIGADGLRLDRHFRTLRLASTARRQFAVLGDDSRALLQAYAGGVNAWLDERGSDLPPTFRLLRLRPEPWSPADSIGVSLLMAYQLSFWNDRPEEARFRWLRAFGHERLAELLGEPQLEIAEEIAALAAGATAVSRLDDRVGDLSHQQPHPGTLSPSNDGARPGSNSWAVGAKRSLTGGPLVANDPHLALRLPAPWYQALLRAPDLEVAGMTLPGLPLVVIGRNTEISWALTSAMVDDHDLFFEQLDDDDRRVRRGDKWLPVSSALETIRARGGNAEQHLVRWTDLGPLLEADNESGLPARSLRWMAYETADPVAAFSSLAHANSLDDVSTGIDGYLCPAQNLLVAHRSGALLQTILGRTPERRRGSGRLPVPAWNPDFGWTEPRPRATNPTVYGSGNSVLVTANNDIRPPDYSLPFTADFDTPHGADRIRQLLARQPRWSAENLGVVQTDVVSSYALQLVALLDDEYQGNAQRALQVLSTWDGSMQLSGPAALFALLEHQLNDRIFADEAALYDVPVFADRRLLLQVLAAETDPYWYDDVTTTAIESRWQTLQRALESAWHEAVELWEEKPGGWEYGTLHSLTLQHPVGGLPIIGRWFRRGPIPLSGSATTVAAFGGRWDQGRQPVVYGPSMRWISDTASGDGSLAVLPTGQSGHPADLHYDDQLPLYLAGILRPVRWSDAAIRQHTISVLVLSPGVADRVDHR